MPILEINGSVGHATVFVTEPDANGLEPYAKAQLERICNHEMSRHSAIRVMPDVHAGKVGPIGLTMTIGDMILPQLVGIDIGCGLTLATLGKYRNDFQKLDVVLRDIIPSGSANRMVPHRWAHDFDFSRLRMYRHLSLDRVKASLGTLGGGNHFIEIDKDDRGQAYMAVHSGSRYLGFAVTEYYMRKGFRSDTDYEMTTLTGALMDDYLHDMNIVCEFAALNRQAMIHDVSKAMKWKVTDLLNCTHNYVDMSGKRPMLRKGAISARRDEPVLIPINMRDGIILGRGLGNDAWNQSAPHGAGRIMKRTDVKQQFTVSDFKKSMKHVYSPSVSKQTLDEAPFAYRKLDDIAAVIGDTVQIDQVLTPLYSYKAGGDE